MQLKCIRVKNSLSAPTPKLRNTLEIAAFLGIFILLLVYNRLTPYLVDDFNYCFSFQTGDKLSGILDILPSMLAHASSMNGRLAAHSLVQLFSLLPNWVFDLVNAAMFALQIHLLCSFTPKSQTRWLQVPLAFFSLMLFELAFGQVNLWQDGAINYLWSVVFALLFLRPFATAFLSAASISAAPRWQAWLALLGGFFVGAYSETVSAASIFCGAALVLAQWYTSGRRFWNIQLLARLAAAMVGYVTIYLAPAQWKNKSVSGNIGLFWDGFLRADRMYLHFWVLLLVFGALFSIAIAKKADRKRLLLALSFLGSSLVANFMLAFASYYPERASVGAFVFLLCADMVLCATLLEDRKAWRPFMAATVVLILCCVKPVYYGSYDILRTYREICNNKNTIVQSQQSGVRDVSLPLVIGRTKYSAIYDLTYLDSQNCFSWPNDAMAKYYSMDSISGIAEPEGS